jgi:transcriptional regulator GlxA family with amidase domain
VSVSDKKIKCYFLILPGFLPLDLAGPLQVMLTANNNLELYQIDYIAMHSDESNSVNMKGGLCVTNLQNLPDILESNTRLIIPGLSNTAEFMQSPAGKKISGWLAQQKQVENLTIATICSGALLLASSGLLYKRNCTTHFSLLTRLKSIEPSAKIDENSLYVKDQNIWSSAGISSGIDMMLAMLEQDTNARFAAQVAREMVVYLRRSANDPQLSPWLAGRNHMQQKIHTAQDIICAELQQSLSVECIAKHVNMSSRNLTRVFKQSTGQSIQKYAESLKLAIAEKLLENTGASLESVAAQSGFQSVRSFRRVWDKHHLQTPINFRTNTQIKEI